MHHLNAAADVFETSCGSLKLLLDSGACRKLHPRTDSRRCWPEVGIWEVTSEVCRSPTDRQSAGLRPETLECGRADLAHFSHTNPTETKRNRTCEKQNEFGFIVSGRPYFLVVDNWERPSALPTSPFLANQETLIVVRHMCVSQYRSDRQSTSLLVSRSPYCWGNDSHPPPSALYKAIRFVVTAVWLCAKRSSLS